jgi:hypothetical protein
MMGKKERYFAPLTNVSLEELVPHDHFYRHVEGTLDLSFVREFVQQTYAGIGRPSIDPVVFFPSSSIPSSNVGTMISGIGSRMSEPPKNCTLMNRL